MVIEGRVSIPRTVGRITKMGSLFLLVSGGCFFTDAITNGEIFVEAEIMLAVLLPNILIIQSVPR